MIINKEVNMSGKYFYRYQDAYKAYAAENDETSDDIFNIYYYGEEEIKSTIENIIYLPLDRLFETFVDSDIPYPTTFTFNGIPFDSEEEISIFENYVNETSKRIIDTREKLDKSNLESLFSKIRNLSDEKLRVYMFSSKATAVIQHVLNNLKDALETSGKFEVMLKNFEIYEHGDTYTINKYMVDFNPHILFLCNHQFKYYENKLPGDIFRFTWIQDPINELVNEVPIEVRKNDIFYTLINPFDKFLQAKEVPFSRQSFCINDKLFRSKAEVARENKLVFIGSSYINHFEANERNLKAVELIKELYFSSKKILSSDLEKISNDTGTSLFLLELKILPYVIRDLTLEYLCQMKLPLVVEVYGGDDWRNNEIVGPYYKRKLKYGEEIVDIYNSAKYSLAPHADYVLQQRVLESAACGCIPIVYDCRYKCDDPDYSDSLIYYTNPAEIGELLEGDTKDKDLNKIVRDNSYSKLANRIYDTVKSKKELRDGR